MTVAGPSQHHPLIFAHRGASGAAPENTLAAFSLAMEMGADGIELDVTRCATGEIVVIHDDTVDRTTNGSGRVREHALGILSELDAGGWFGPEYRREKIPLLREVLDLVGSRLMVNIEIKVGHVGKDGIEKEIVEMVRSRRLMNSVIISSFGPMALYRSSRAAPEIACGLLYAPNMPLPLARGWARHLLTLAALHPEKSMVTARYMAKARGAGYKVNAWTVNEVKEMERLITLDVDGIITNYPDRALRLLAG